MKARVSQVIYTSVTVNTLFLKTSFPGSLLHKSYSSLNQQLRYLLRKLQVALVYVFILFSALTKDAACLFIQTSFHSAICYSLSFVFVFLPPMQTPRKWESCLNLLCLCQASRTVPGTQQAFDKCLLNWIKFYIRIKKVCICFQNSPL